MGIIIRDGFDLEYIHIYPKSRLLSSFFSFHFHGRRSWYIGYGLKINANQTQMLNLMFSLIILYVSIGDFELFIYTAIIVSSDGTKQDLHRIPFVLPGNLQMTLGFINLSVNLWVKSKLCPLPLESSKYCLYHLFPIKSTSVYELPGQNNERYQKIKRLGGSSP